MNKKARLAWELYLKMDTSNDSFNLLQLIAVNDLPDAPYFPTRVHQTCNENSLPSPQQEL